MSTYPTASADSGDDSQNSTEVSVRILPRPSTAPDWDKDYYGDDDDHYGGLPFTGPGQSVTFALEGGVVAILLGSLLVFVSTRAGSGRHPGER